MIAGAAAIGIGLLLLMLVLVVRGWNKSDRTDEEGA